MVGRRNEQQVFQTKNVLYLTFFWLFFWCIFLSADAFTRESTRDNASTDLITIPNRFLHAEVRSTVTDYLAALRNEDAPKVLSLREYPDGSNPSLERMQQSLQGWHKFWNYETWTLQRSYISYTGLGKRWGVEVNLDRASGYSSTVNLLVESTPTGWKIVDVDTTRSTFVPRE